MKLLAVIVGVLFVFLAGIYFVQPANSLPPFLPGFDASETVHHFKHAVAALLLGLASLTFAWFQTGKKSA